MSEQLQQDRLILILQKGVLYEPRPFFAIGRQLEMSEDQVIDQIRKLQQSGIIRRFGGVFNSASLGFKSCLCAVNVPADELDRVNAMISPDSGVTHCYIRKGEPNLWFTFTADELQYEKGLEKFNKNLNPYKLLVLPAIKKYKTQVIFDKSQSRENIVSLDVPQLTVLELSAKEKQLVRYLQGNIPVSASLFKDIAHEVNYREDELFDLLNKWVGNGALKRVAAIIRHQKFGFTGNALCLWNVSEEQIDEVGGKLAERPDVSHCYQREMKAEFPYNFYAMVHAETQQEVVEKFLELEKREHLQNGRMFLSTRELKKTSPVYF